MLFLVINLPPIFANLADAQYFKFKFKRTTAEILGIRNDVFEQATQLVFYYWYIVVLFILIVFLFVKYYPKASSNQKPIFSNYKLFLVFIPLTLGLTILGIRGGFQLKPLRPNHAFTHTPNVLGNLVLNTPFSFIQTLQTPGVEPVQYFRSDQEAKNIIIEKYFKKPNKKESDRGPKTNDNVVIIVLESFSAEYVGVDNKYQGFTPFLDSLSKEGLYYSNHYANGTTSIEALPAILASVPSLMSESYITSIYQTNEVHGLGEILGSQNYHTSFFHGGKNGTMGFDVFAKNAGFKQYFGLNEYPNKEVDYDGNWGIFDEPYLQYFSKK
ncbi:MAG TPA: sulfatase-like hydrolase/transferase, partial [Cytophagaceae bacterium]